MEKIYRVIMRKARNEAYDADLPKLGRRTIDDGWLSANRDSLANILCSWWPQIGSQLTNAATRERLIQALQPVKDHPNRHLLVRLLRQTKTTADAIEIRRKRLAYGEAVRSMNNAQTSSDKCMNACRQIEVATTQASPEQINLVLCEFSNRRTECQQAQNQLRNARAIEKALEEELFDKEAAFAQDELLIFIIKRKYALHPMNLANAMAGLPCAIDVPFLGVWQSHARCSKLECAGWPSYHYQVFETIESLWERSESSVDKIEFFRQEIEVLPKTVRTRLPGEPVAQKRENFVRKYLSDNWWYLQRAIEKSLQATDDPRPAPFIICSILDDLLATGKTAADLVMIEAARIR